ncbi:Bacterial Ig-like domain (group 2) [compost metagenome]
MTFSPKYGHHHLDPLNLGLFANGLELLPDIGYTSTLYRYPSVSTLGHNTVVVDSSDMDVQSSRDGGSLELFAPIGPSMQVMRARQENAYPGVEQYSREPWYIGFPLGDGSDGYVVDVFRIAGGSRHEYTLQGDANYDTTLETALPLTNYGPNLLTPGSTWVEATRQAEKGSASEDQYPGYIYMKDIQSAPVVDGQYELDFVTRDNNQLKGKLKVRGFAGEGDNELLIGNYPSLKMTRLNSKALDTNEEAIQYTMPKFVVRREGANLKSTFTTVLEPYSGQSGTIIEQAKVMNADASETGNVALEVTYGNVTDLIFSSNNPDEPFVVGDVKLQGKMGFIRMEDGIVQSMTLVGGTLLKKGYYEVTDTGAAAGKITDVLRVADGHVDNAFVTDTVVSQENVGKYMIVTHPDETSHGYKIKDIATTAGSSILILDDMDPGFRIGANGSSRMTSYPMKQWTGDHRFVIDNIATAIQVGKLFVVPERSNIAVGESTPLSVSVLQGDGTPINLAQLESVHYESSDTSIATVDVGVDGMVRVAVLSPGTAMITVTVILNGIEMKQTAAISVMGTTLPIRTGTMEFTDLADNAVTALNGMSHIRLKTQVDNMSASDQSVLLIVALCDVFGNVLRVAEVNKMIAAGMSEPIATELDVSDQTAGSFLKIMVWNSKSGMQPYSSEMQFPNGTGR